MPEPSTTHLVLIPSFNTGEKVLETVREALQYWAPVWVVVDGSTDGSGTKLEALEGRTPNLRVVRQARNQGKGAAVYRGTREALLEGFTHVLCMDADGQHPAESIPDFMALSHARPDWMILGKPIFDESAPRVRVQGRKISNFWAHLLTVWSGVGDSLFGMRVYPAEPLSRVMGETRWGRRFDFDPEMVVRLVWSGVRPMNLDTPVRYLTAGEGGVSHFHYFRDNTLLTWMYLRLFFGNFLWRLPKLIAQRKRWKLETALEDPDSPESLRRICEKITGHYRKKWFHHYSKIKFRMDPVYEAVFQILKPVEKPVLDIGSGIGMLAFYLRERGLEAPVTGIDNVKDKVAAAQKIADENYKGVEFRVTDAREPLPDVKGSVTILDMLQFLTPQQQQELLREAAQRIPEGGVLVIRSTVKEPTFRFRISKLGDGFAKWTFWMKDFPVHYPRRVFLEGVLEQEGMVEDEFRPLWGKTWFNNYLIVFRRPVTKDSGEGTTQE